jgi:hypothetical protein
MSPELISDRFLQFASRSIRPVNKYLPQWSVPRRVSWQLDFIALLYDLLAGCRWDKRFTLELYHE